MSSWWKQKENANKAQVTKVCLYPADWIIDALYEMSHIHSGGISTCLPLGEQ